MVISSGDAHCPFQVAGLVFGFASQTEGCNTPIDPEDVYEKALRRLTESAKEMKADGLFFVGFQSSRGMTKGCSGPQNAFEVFAWGTAVRWPRPRA